MLKGVEGISFVQFDDKDVVRHTLVQRIVKAYERYNETIGAGRQLSSLKLGGSPETARRLPPARTPRRRPERRHVLPGRQYRYVPPRTGGCPPARAR